MTEYDLIINEKLFMKMRCFYSTIKTVIRKAGEIMLEKIIELTNEYLKLRT